MNVSEIKDALQSELVARGCFLVDVSVSKDNDIVVTIESENGKIELDDCVALSRYFETRFDREVEDYSLTMTSAGLGQPFKVLQQYQNHVGLEVEVLTKEGKKLKGILKEATAEEFTVTVSRKEKKEGAKRPVLVEEDMHFAYDSVKYTKYIINFK